VIKRLSCFVAFACLMVTAQQTAPEGFQLWTASSLSQMNEELKTQAAGNAHHLGMRKLADFQNDWFILSHREADGVVEWHETQADVFLVKSGSATLLYGGNMVGGETVEPHERRNGTIEGGMRQKLSAGDIVRIPARTPHQLLLDGAKEFTYFVIKVKGY
jgi:mannose-6-phosphate isomerase-like protein (cupin superfamily)